MSPQVFNDHRTLWVNSGTTGGAIGRFSRRGMDVHSDDCASCHNCRAIQKRETLESAWAEFRAAMLSAHGIALSETPPDLEWNE